MAYWRGIPAGLILKPQAKSKIYVFECGGYRKVGIAQSIVKRHRQLQQASPHPIYLECYRTIPAAYARQIEKRVHQALREHHHRGEWFSTELAIIKEAIAGALRDVRPLIASDAAKLARRNGDRTGSAVTQEAINAGAANG